MRRHMKRKDCIQCIGHKIMALPYHTIQDSWFTIIIAIYGNLLTYLQLLEKTKAHDSGYARTNEICYSKRQKLEKNRKINRGDACRIVQASSPVSNVYSSNGFRVFIDNDLFSTATLAWLLEDNNQTYCSSSLSLFLIQSDKNAVPLQAYRKVFCVEGPWKIYGNISHWG